MKLVAKLIVLAVCIVGLVVIASIYSPLTSESGNTTGAVSSIPSTTPASTTVTTQPSSPSTTVATPSSTPRITNVSDYYMLMLEYIPGDLLSSLSSKYYGIVAVVDTEKAREYNSFYGGYGLMSCFLEYSDRILSGYFTSRSNTTPITYYMVIAASGSSKLLDCVLQGFEPEVIENATTEVVGDYRLWIINSTGYYYPSAIIIAASMDNTSVSYLHITPQNGASAEEAKYVAIEAVDAIRNGNSWDLRNDEISSLVANIPSEYLDFVAMAIVYNGEVIPGYMCGNTTKYSLYLIVPQSIGDTIKSILEERFHMRGLESITRVSETENYILYLVEGSITTYTSPTTIPITMTTATVTTSLITTTIPSPTEGVVITDAYMLVQHVNSTYCVVYLYIKIENR